MTTTLQDLTDVNADPDRSAGGSGTAGPRPGRRRWGRGSGLPRLLLAAAVVLALAVASLVVGLRTAPTRITPTRAASNAGGSFAGKGLPMPAIAIAPGAPADAQSGGVAPVPLAATGGQAAGEPATAGGQTSGTASGGGLAGGSSVGSQVGVVGPRVVRNGDLTLVVDHGQVTPTLTRVGQLAQGAGGYIASSQTQEEGQTPSGTVTLRVPVDHFDATVAAVRSLRARVRSASVSGRDVTADYADLQSQLTTLKAARRRYLDILAATKTIGDVLTVQQRVDDVSGQIDRLEWERRVLASQSDLGTLTVTVAQSGDPLVSQPSPRSGIAQAFDDAGNGFLSGLEALIRGSGPVLLVTLCLLALLGLCLAGRRGWRRVSAGTLS